MSSAEMVILWMRRAERAVAAHNYSDAELAFSKAMDAARETHHALGCGETICERIEREVRQQRAAEARAERHLKVVR